MVTRKGQKRRGTGTRITAVVRARYSAVFSNWILFRRKLVQLGIGERRNVIVDLSQTKLVDHSVMEKLHELESDFEDAGLRLEVRGLEEHKQLSDHSFAARKRAMTRLRRVTVVADQRLERQLAETFYGLGASGYTAIPCRGAGRTALAQGDEARDSQIRIEAVVIPDVADSILDYLRREVIARDHHITTCLETVEFLRQDAFTPAGHVPVETCC